MANRLKSIFSVADQLTLMDSLGDKERKAIFKIGTGILKDIVNKLVEEDFYWILPVMLSKSTDPLWPDSTASIEKKIEVEIYGEKVKTMQSMIIQKRVLVSLGPEKFFILSPNIRIERRERAGTGKHLYEFTQLDIEMAQTSMSDIFKLFEDLISSSISTVKENLGSELDILRRELRVPQTPFKVYKRGTLEEEYGGNWEEAVSKELKNPIWVTDLPREFYDYEDEKKGEWRNFDLILSDGYGEAVSGAEREFEYSKLIKKLEKDGLNNADFQPLLKLAKEGRLKPSTGAGLGIERFVAYICGTKHVAEVQPFPRIPGMVPGL